MSPTAGPVGGGILVTVTGSGFSKITKVAFGGTAGTSLKVLSTTKLTVVAPKHAVGMVDVRVTGGYGESTATARDHYTFETAPKAPFVESVSGAGLGVLVRWAPPTSADHVQGFSVTATPAAGSPAACGAQTVTAGPDDTQALVGQLCDGVVYTVQMKARNAAGYSPTSAVSPPAVPLSAQVPGAPLMTSVTPRDGSLVVAWAPPASDGGNPVEGYTLTATGGATTVTVKAAATAASATLTGLANGTSYTLSLTATNAVGDSSAAAGSGTPQAAHAPSAPAELSVVPDGKGGLVASWSPPADNGGSAITGYTVSYQRAEFASGTWAPVSGAPVHKIAVSASAASATAKTFEDQKAFYLFSVKAANSAGTSPAATQQAAVTPVVTAASGVTVLSQSSVAALASVTSSTLSWNDPAPAQALALETGQTVVAAPGAQLPQGTLRRVVSVSHTGGKLTVTTTQAQLSDAFAAMGLDASVNPVGGTANSPVLHSSARSSPRFRPTVAGVRVIRDASVTTGGSIFLSVDVKVGHVAVQAQVSLTSLIGVAIGVHKGFLNVPDGVSVSSTAKVTAAVSGTVQVSGDWSTEIGEIDGAPIDIQVGPVPVVVVPKVPVFLTASGSTGLGIQVSGAIGGSVSWSSTNPTHLTASNLSGSPSVKGSVVPGVTATGDLALGLKVQPQADIYDAAGPNVEGDLNLDGKVDFTPAPGDPFLTIGPKLQLKAGIALDLFHQHASLEATIGSYAFAAFLINQPPAASYTITPAGATVGAGGTLTLQATRSDGTSEPVIWSLLGGTRSDSISSSGTLQVSSPAGRTLTVAVSDASGAAGETTVTVGAEFDTPSDVTATQNASNTGAAISWTAPTATGGSALAGYTILTEPSTGTHTVSSGTTSLALTSLSPGSYVVQVYAKNTAGQVSAPGTAMLSVSGAALTFDHSQSLDVADEHPDSISCPTTSFCMSVGYFGEVGIYRSGQWRTGPSLANAIVPSLSCRSATFCMLTYQDGGSSTVTSSAAIFNGTRWSAPVKIDTGSVVSSLSCGSTTSCLAIDYAGQVVRYNGSGWSKPQKVIQQGTADSISCVSASSCLATAGNEWARYASGKWSAPAAIKPAVVVSSVSCVSASDCVGIGYDGSGKTSDGESTTFNGSTWSAPAAINSYGGLDGDGQVQSLESLSCKSATFCMAADWEGRAYRFDGKSWHSAGRVFPVANNGEFGFVVSCVSASWCAAAGDVSDADVAATWTPAGWSRTADFGTAVSGVSCASATFCVATGNEGLDQTLTVASVFNGTAWSTPVIVDPNGGQPEVSCPSADFCMLTAWYGDAVSYKNGAWSAPVTVETGNALIAVSCASASFCVAIDTAGHAYTYNGTAWSGPVLVEDLTGTFNGGLTSVSCPTTATCVAADAYGHAISYANGSWSAPVAVTGLTYISSVDCTSVSFCIASGSSTGNASELATAKFDGTSWTSLPTPAVQSNHDYGGVSCASSSFCGLSSTEEAPLIFENGAWSSSFTPTPRFTNAISCAAADWCAAAGWTDTMLWSSNTQR